MERDNNLQKVCSKTWKTLVFIVTFQKGKEEPEGEIFNIHIPAGIPFQGLGDMMMKMDRIYDLLDYPQSEIKIREWDDREKWKGTLLESRENWNFEEDAMEKFQIPDTDQNPFVYVETRFRRYGSWQGILRAGDRKLSYRSALEFLHYMMGYVQDTFSVVAEGKDIEQDHEVPGQQTQRRQSIRCVKAL